LLLSPPLHIHLLGDFLLASGETPITSAIGSRAQSLLAYLVLHQATPPERSRLAFLLWPDSTEAQAHTNLRKALHQLRQVLPDTSRLLHADAHSIQWLAPSADSWTLDVLTFEQMLLQGKQAEQAQDAAMERQALEQALRLYRGDLLPGCYDEWILPERDRLRQLFLSAMERLIALLEQERDYSAAIAAAQQLLRHDALHEATYRQLMRLYALRNERTAALRVYHTCVTVLERELGVEPGEATQALYESLIQSKASVERKTGPLTSRGTAPPLLGRKREWQQLQVAWRKAAAGQPQLVLLWGEAGIGKTRLAEEMEAWVSRQGMVTASARCYAALGELTYASVTAWLRADAFRRGLRTLDAAWLPEVARLVPEVLTEHPKLPRPGPITEGWQRQYFFEALARAVLNAHQPLLLLLDDLQWCDNETFEWLHYLIRFDPKARFLLIGTVRTEEIVPEHPLLALQSALQRDNLVTEITLGPLTTTETASLAEHIIGHQLDPTLTDTLYAETEGNPLFVVELLRAGTLERCRTGSPSPQLLQPPSTLPPSVQSVLTSRFAQLSPLAAEVAHVAAVIGRGFTFPVLTHACRKPEDAVVRGLDELWQRRIVREQDAAATESYDFSHDKLREHAYASLSPAHRRLLHRHVAEAFEQVYAQDLDAVSGQIAIHYESARLPQRAIPYYQRAGEAALRIYANAEAISAFQRATALLEASGRKYVQQGQQWEAAVAVYELLGDVLATTGQLPQARQSYQRATSYISVPLQERGYIWQARLLRKMAGTWNHVSSNPLDITHVNARQAFQEAERILKQVPDQSNTTWRNEWIELQFEQIWPLRGTIDDMTATIEKARPIVEQYGTQEQRERLAFAIVTRDIIRARYVASEQTISTLQAKIAELQPTQDKSKLGTLYFVLGLSLFSTARLDEAERQLENALHIGEQLGIVWLQNRCLTFLPLIYRRRGQVERVREILTRTQATGVAEKNRMLIGHRAWVAWRDGKLDEAETYGRMSIEVSQQQQDVNAFRWVGLWPLIGVMLTRERVAEAMTFVRMLLDPTQQPLPEQLSTLLVTALQAWESAEQERASALLQQAASAAQLTGYL
jgi:DNA-binding SARP family transcriptional activator